MNTRILPAVIGLLFFLLIPATRAAAQETTVAVGYVSSTGTLLRSANALGGTVSSSRPDTGEFHITVDAPGAFVGAGIGDFMVQAMVRSAAASDRGTVAEISSVSADSLTVVVYVSDVEDDTNLSLALPANSAFQFVIHRFPSGPSVAAASRFLYATGVVIWNGELVSGATADGSTIASERTATGDYRLTFTNSSGYSGQALAEYLVFATPRSSSLSQDHLAVGTADSIAGNELRITVNTSDVQNASDLSPEAEDTTFQFAVYRTIESGSSGPAESGLLVGAASVDGSNGLLRRGATSFPGGYVTSDRSGEGSYRVVLHAPGRFVGRSLGEFSVQAGINSTAHSDDIVGALPFLIDGDSLTIEVRTPDVEQNGQLFGTGVNNDFFLTIHDAVATSRPDLRIGRTPSLTAMRGNNRYNTNAAGQRVGLTAKGGRAVRVHFAAENDGNTTQGVRVRGRTGKGLAKTRCFRVTGGRANVTASFRTTGHLAEAMRPSEAVRFFVSTKFSPKTSKRRSIVRLFARPEASPAPADAARATIRKR